MLKCKNCKYFMSAKEKSNVSLCKREPYWEVTDPDNSCRYLPEEKKPVCGDCSHFASDPACFGMHENEVPIWHDTKLCSGFSYKNEDNFFEVLSFWKSRGIYNRDKIDKMIDDFESDYADLENQAHKGGDPDST